MSETEGHYPEDVAACVERFLPSWDASLAQRVRVSVDTAQDPIVELTYLSMAGIPIGRLELPVFFPGNERHRRLPPEEAAAEMMPDVLHGATQFPA